MEYFIKCLKYFFIGMLVTAVSIFLIKSYFGSEWTSEDYVEIVVIGSLALMLVDNKKPK
tara:strand:+ start:269 stop:445 length:177 start_codon:yes stop_codon:yes gene_type:complete